MARSWVSRLVVPLAAIQLFNPASGQMTTSVASISSSAASRTATATASGSSPSPSANSTEPKVHLIKAGAGGFKFEPAEIKDVAVGDIVTFEFYPPDHSVARAEYGSACVPYEYTGKDKVGFWSETQWVDSVNELTHWNLTINSAEPIFFYCAAPESCTKQHMVGVINPNDTQTLADQVKSAAQADFQVAPGQPIPKEATTSLLAPTATGAPSSSSNNSHGSKLSGGAIAGIVVGAVAFLVICAALFFFVGRTKSLKEVIKRNDATVTKTTHDSAHYGPNGPMSPGFQPGQSPFSPNSEFGTPVQQGTLSNYGQHNVHEQHPSGWGSPPAQHGQPGVTGHQEMSETKYAQMAPVEMASPTPGTNEFAAELEAPIKSPRT